MTRTSKVWDRLTGNFWLPEKIPLSNDDSVVEHVEAARAADDHASSPASPCWILSREPWVLCRSSPMRSHRTRRPFTQILRLWSRCTRSRTRRSLHAHLHQEIDETFRWSEENEFLQTKAKIILDYYRGDDPEKRKVASTMLESFLFYSGFYAPMYWSAHAKLTNTADLIRLIIRDEAVHGYYIGYKYQLGLM